MPKRYARDRRGFAYGYVSPDSNGWILAISCAGRDCVPGGYCVGAGATPEIAATLIEQRWQASLHGQHLTLDPEQEVVHA